MDPDDPSESGSGFSAFLQAVAAAPPPDRAYAPGAVVRDVVRISRPLFESGDVRIYLAASPEGDVALVRQPALDPRAHQQRLDAWAHDSHEGRVRVTWSDIVDTDVVMTCLPVPVGTLRAWLDAGPHPWPQVAARLGPVAKALVRSHAVGVSGFSIDADGLWLGLDGHVRLPPPVPGRGDHRAEDRAQLRALVRAAVGSDIQLPKDLVGDRDADPAPTESLARAFERVRPRLWSWLIGAAAILVGAAWWGRPASTVAPVVTPARASDVHATHDQWKHALMRVDAGDPTAHEKVDALAREDMPAHVALLRGRLADDAQRWEEHVEHASKLPADDARLRAEIGLERAGVALHRGALLEAYVWLAEARTHAARTTDAPALGLRRVEWELQSQSKFARLDTPAIRAAILRASAPSLQRVEVQSALARALEAEGLPGQALEQHAMVLNEPRAQIARLRVRTHVARAHLLVALARPGDALQELDLAEPDLSTAVERAALHLARASVARAQVDRGAANDALTRAAAALAELPPCVLHVDLAYERAAWMLRAGTFSDARAELSAALSLHDALRGVDARSRVPLERAYRNALEDDAALMTSSPPSHASASP